MSDTQVTPPVSGDAPSDTGKILAALGYITGVVAIVALLLEPYKDERFVRHHAIQAIGLLIGYIIVCVVNIIPILGQLVWLAGSVAVAVFAIMGLVKSLQNEMWEMPLIYGLVSKYI